ncbi:MAG: radical SAM protein [Patescibacteria group bacterium]
MKMVKKNEAKLALITLQNEGDRQPPFGLLYLATYLEKKIGFRSTKIIDKNFGDVMAEVREYKPDLAGISAMTIHYEEASECAKAIKEALRIPVIIGGVHISLLPNSLRTCFDVGVVGEGEETFKELVCLYQEKQKFNPADLRKIKGIAFWNENGKIEITVQREFVKNLDEIPPLDYEYADKRYFEPKPIIGIGKLARRGWILTSRGCPFRCRFCATSAFWGSGLTRFHSPQYIVSHIKYLKENFKIKHLLFCDDLFTMDRNRLREIARLCEKENLLEGITTTAQARANTIDDEMGEICRKLNIKILQFGFESGSKKVLQWLKGPTASPEINLKAIEISLRHKIKVFGSLMMGIPEETLEDMKETYEFIKKAVKKGAYLFLFVATPYPGGEFWEIARNQKKVSEEMDFTKLSLYSCHNPLLLDEKIDKEKFAELFLETRKLLRFQKYKMVWEILLNDPLGIILIILKNPFFWLKRISLWIGKR